MQSFTGTTQNIGSAVQKIGDTIDTVMESIRPPLIPIPPMLMFCEMMQRPGMSATVLASEIIAGLEALGIPTGPNPDGSENLIVNSIIMICRKLIEHIHSFARVDSATQPGSARSTGTGTAAGIAPVQVECMNDSFYSSYGSVR